jgi:hypothetical protein
MTRVLSVEDGKRRPCEVDEAKQVRLNLITKASFRHLFDGGAIGRARVVDNDVEGAKASVDASTAFFAALESVTSSASVKTF